MKYNLNQVRNRELTISQLEEHIEELYKELKEPEIPKEIYDKHYALNRYNINNDLKTFDIIHIYSSNELCYPNGYYDSMWMNVCIFNSNTMEKRWLKQRDGLMFNILNKYPLYLIRTYMDGSTLIRFNSILELEGVFNCLQIK